MFLGLTRWCSSVSRQGSFPRPREGNWSSVERSNQWRASILGGTGKVRSSAIRKGKGIVRRPVAWKNGTQRLNRRPRNSRQTFHRDMCKRILVSARLLLRRRRPISQTRKPKMHRSDLNLHTYVSSPQTSKGQRKYGFWIYICGTRQSHWRVMA